MSEFYGTREAARLLGMSPTALTRAVWDYRVNAPQKSPSGAYLWTVGDLNNASWRLYKKPFVMPNQQLQEPARA